MGRFLNADGYVSTGFGILDTNMFTYCGNNPVNLIDVSGNFASAIAAGAALGASLVPVIVVAAAVVVTAVVLTNPSVQRAISKAVSSAGKALYDASQAIGSAVRGVVEQIAPQPDVEFKHKVEIGDLAPAIPANPFEKKHAVFPANPYDFHPRGMDLIIRKPMSSEGNGGIFHWVLPGTSIAIFEWDEDYIHGSHYHQMKIYWKNKHYGPHKLPGETVDEPWNTTYFGLY